MPNYLPPDNLMDQILRDYGQEAVDEIHNLLGKDICCKDDLRDFLQKYSDAKTREGKVEPHLDTQVIDGRIPFGEVNPELGI